MKLVGWRWAWWAGLLGHRVGALSTDWQDDGRAPTARLCRIEAEVSVELVHVDRVPPRVGRDVAAEPRAARRPCRG